MTRAGQTGLLVALAVIVGATPTTTAQSLLDAHELERRVGPAVVFIRAYQGGGASTEGTGFLVSSNGWVVTNQHVLGDSDDVEVWVQAAPDFARYDALVLVNDDRRDLALLRIDGHDLIAAALAPPDDVRPGTAVASLGFPEGIFDYDRRMRIVPGVVSHTGFPLGDVPDRRWIVSDVKLREGNSGGPLVDLQGRVVGVNTIRRLDGETSLSIPVREIHWILADLLQLRDDTLRAWQAEAERLRHELGWCRRTLGNPPPAVGPVSRVLVDHQLRDSERLLEASATSLMTGQWVQAQTQLEGTMLQVRWLRGVLR